jgi:hypothetical protein
MKKTFFQLHIGVFFSALPLLIFGVLGLYAIILSFTDPEIKELGKIFFPLAGLGIMIICAWSFYASFYHRIIFSDDKIIITGDKSTKDSKIQYKDEIVFSEIKDVKFIISSMNSKKKISSLLNSAPKSYFEFEMENGKSKWVYIFYFSKKQREEMIRIINEKAGLNLDYNVLYKNYEHRPERKKKKKAK